MEVDFKYFDKTGFVDRNSCSFFALSFLFQIYDILGLKKGVMPYNVLCLKYHSV